MAFARKYTDEQYAEAADLVSQGASISEASNAVGIPYQSLYRKIRKPDPKPGGGGRKPKAVKIAVTDEQLIDFLSKAATLPAVPMGLYVHCTFCAEHFSTQGPEAAKQLVELSKEHAQLRQMLELIWREWQKAAWAALLAGYFGVPLAHHLAPDALYKWIAVPMGLPPRGVQHSHATSNGYESAPAPTPFAGLDTESILSMARAMGIRIDLPDDILMSDGPTTETDSAEPAESAETTAAPVASDSDAGE